MSVPFGFRNVDEAAKDDLVRGVFSSVARRYDLMNDLMSAGVHRLWKDAMIDWLAPRPGARFLDVAGGTGDIAFRIASATANHAESSIVCCDINAEMLEEGIGRLSNQSYPGIHWICANAENLPFPASFFDAYTIGFGIRNMTHIERALSEARRVLKPGGRFLCLEFSRVEIPGLDAIYDAYSFRVLPWLGRLVAGDGEPYRYLAESIRRFPSQRLFAKMIANAGFGRVQVRNLAGGIAALHSAWKT
jgi:demethylmenaquinone methyltransferase / 2-methoxy-6-polyprenyl-1,4-benzoquinol methylase